MLNENNLVSKSKTIIIFKKEATFASLNHISHTNLKSIVLSYPNQDKDP